MYARHFWCTNSMPNDICMRHIESSKLHASYQQWPCQRLCKPAFVLILSSLLCHTCFKHSACTCEQMPKLDFFTSTLDLLRYPLHSPQASLVCLDVYLSWSGCSLSALLLGEDASLYVAQQQQSLQNPRDQLQHDNFAMLRSLAPCWGSLGVLAQPSDLPHNKRRWFWNLLHYTGCGRDADNNYDLKGGETRMTPSPLTNR